MSLLFWQNRGPLQDQILLQNLTPAPLRKCHNNSGPQFPYVPPLSLAKIVSIGFVHLLGHIELIAQNTTSSNECKAHPCPLPHFYSLIFSLPKHEIFSTKLKSTILVIIDACAPKKPFSKISVFLPNHTTESVS